MGVGAPSDVGTRIKKKNMNRRIDDRMGKKQARRDRPDRSIGSQLNRPSDRAPCNRSIATLSFLFPSLHHSLLDDQYMRLDARQD